MTAAKRMGTRRPSEPELVGPAEAAEICGARVSNLWQLAGLPEPYDRVRASTLWRRDEIEQFARDRAERLGRTPNAAPDDA